MKYGKELLENLKKEILNRKKMAEDREKRIDNFETDETDCATSIRMEYHNDTIAEMKISILENGGFSDFECLRDFQNNVISTKVISGKYGLCWLIDQKYQSLYGTFVGLAKRESTYTKKGIKTSTIKLPAWVAFKGNGSGMYGAYTGSPIVFPSNINYWTGK